MFTTIIDVETLSNHIGRKGWVIVDCRFDLANPQSAYHAYLASHIPGAVYAHLDHDLSGPPATDHGRHPLPPPDALQSLFRRLGINADSQVVAYDASGGAIAARLWWMLRYMNHQAAAVLDGGWPAWQNADFPVRSGEENNPAGQFQGKPRRDRLVTIDDLGNISLLIDSRDPERYAGVHEPIDPRAGHIPGAVNFPFARQWRADQRLRPSAEIREELTALFGSAASAEAVFYCGSGVTACFNILAQVHAGLPEGKLYVGSWSEWCADEDRPAVVGPEP